jgi:hypothetical protein
VAQKEPCTSVGETHEKAIISLGESCPVSEIQNSEVGDDDHNSNMLIRGGDAVGRRS